VTAAGHQVSLTRAHLLRHAPSSGQGFGAAVIDVAQDLLLRHLSEVGLLAELAFKGGTALRKLYAGAQGRFSLDLDFAVRNLTADVSSVVALLVEQIDGVSLGPFTYGITDRRGKKHLTVATSLAPAGGLSSKLDVNPPPWLEPVHRCWVDLPVHARYGGPLPALPVVRLEENVAEKIARLNRTTTARDVYDLVWLWRNRHTVGGLDEDLVRRLAVLKIWVDAYGLSGPGGLEWKPGHEAYPFDPDRWLRLRPASEFDREDIGQLSVPAPDLTELAQTLRTGYCFLTGLTDEETTLSALSARDRPLLLRLLAELPTSRLAAGSVW
jgi:predicted nucleotidyltransferase component of viral defense system